MSSWVAPSPAAKYGGAQVTEQQATRDATALPSMAGPPAGLRSGGALSPSGPLFWIGLVAAASVGLMAYSTTVRVGPASISANLGK